MSEYCRRRCTRALWEGLAMVMLFTASAQAQNFTVNSTLDAVDAVPGDGSCVDASNTCSLRAAIQEANALAGPDTITLPAGVLQLSISGTGEALAATGDLDITADLTITGAGAGADAMLTTIDGGSLDRVFDIAPGGISISVTLNRLAIRNGAASGADYGGAIRVNAGTVTLNDCSLSGNHADANGGAVFNAGILSVNRCTFSTNTANSGGGLYNNAGTTTLTNTTLSGNSATSFGGGLYNGTGATATVLHATLALNSAASGGGVYNVGTSTFRSVLLSANTGDNCSGTIVSSGTNLDSGTSCGFGAAGDLNTDPQLGALTDNGGPTLTHALPIGSPAIDVADNGSCPLTDQRVVSRPVDGDGIVGAVCDIGAFEATLPVDLSISKSHQADCVSLHNPLIYTIHVTNNGPGDASAVTVTDVLPDGVTLVSTSPACSQSGNTLTCVVAGTFSAGSSATFIINTTADKVAQLTNTASVRAAESDPDTSNNSAEVKTRINCAKGCFIATAAYGSPLAPQVQHLRTFRDRFLMPYSFGQWFVDLYYRYSPPLAEVLAQHDDLRAVVRAGLRPMISFAQFVNEIPPNQDGQRLTEGNGK